MPRTKKKRLEQNNLTNVNETATLDAKIQDILSTDNTGKVQWFIFDRSLLYDKQVDNFVKYSNSRYIKNFSLDFAYSFFKYYPNIVVGDKYYEYKILYADVLYRGILWSLTLEKGFMLPNAIPVITNRLGFILYSASYYDLAYYDDCIEKINGFVKEGVNTIELWGSGLFIIPLYYEKYLNQNIKFIVYEPSEKMYKVASVILEKLKLTNTKLVKSVESNSLYPRFLIYKEVVYEDNTLW